MRNALFVETDLNRVDFTSSVLFQSQFKFLTIMNSTFHQMNMKQVTFDTADIYYSQFIDVTLAHSIFIDRLRIMRCSFVRIHDLNNMNLTKIDVTSSVFDHCDMRNNILTGAKISHTSFQDTNLNGSDFSGCYCSYNHFRHLIFYQISFINATLYHTSWRGTYLINIHFNGADLTYADFFDSIILTNVSFTNIKGDYVNFAETKIANSDFQYCRCPYAYFIKTDLTNVSFDHSQLDYANFSSRSHLSEVSFSNIDGYRIDFSWLIMNNIDLTRAQLKESEFIWSSLINLNLTDTNLEGTDFSYATIAAFEFTNNQYQSILSITGMRINNKVQRNANLLMNTGLVCDTIEKVNRSFWIIEPSNQEITIVQRGPYCFFNVSQPIIMKQTANVSHYRRLIEKEKAKAEVRLNVWNSSAIVYVITTLLGN